MEVGGDLCSQELCGFGAMVYGPPVHGCTHLAELPGAATDAVAGLHCLSLPSASSLPVYIGCGLRQCSARVWKPGGPLEFV